MALSRSVSVIIPVYNDRTRLEKCLRALCNQTYAAVEVIVVDNNSDEDIRSACLPYSFVRYAEERQVGSYAARNKGLDLAKGEVIAFTDSDCIPHEDWVEKGALAFENHSEAAMIGGRIDVFAQNPARPSMAEVYELLIGFPQESYIKRLNFAATANLFTTRDVFTKVGKFDASLRSGGDKEWGQRLASNGYRIAYSDEMKVSHPARRSLKEIIRKTLRTRQGVFDQQWKNLTLSSYCFDLLRFTLPPFGMLFTIFKNRDYELRKRLAAMGIAIVVRLLFLFEHIRSPFRVLSGRQSFR